MCGITGIVSQFSLPEEHVLQAMTDSLIHRGPDDSGVWVDSDAGIGLGHRRLSILDLSSLGRQPMHSHCGRFVLAYNGEVYNHLELRKELADYPFRSTSDTETILAAIAEWGIDAALNRFTGMFAIGLWDKQTRKMFLVRDRMGIKPLYYGLTEDKDWVFGSELKALQAHPRFSPAIDRNALTSYFRHNYISAPYTIYEDTWKVEPGQMVIIGEDGVEKKTWWNVEDRWRSGFENPWQMDDSEATDALEALLLDAVNIRMLSDVPLGAFLSGGIDSSTVVALMQAHSSLPVRTFSIGFHEADFNEAGHAKAVAKHLETDHTELYVTPQDLLNVVPNISQYWDEPFADSSQIPTYVLSSLAREHVTVSLSGDGGDELFCGYDRYFLTNRVNAFLSKTPWFLKKLGAELGKATPEICYQLLGNWEHKARLRLDVLGTGNLAELYRYFISHFKDPASFVLGGEEPFLPGVASLPDPLAWMSLHDLRNYLPDNILTKVDRASMAVSLEARVPLLDHRVVEFAAAVPTSMKVRNGQGKWLLKEVLYRHIPKELVDRPKVGFGVPIHKWLREDLREWCEDMLAPDRMRRQGYIDAEYVQKMWREHLSGKHNWHSCLWEVLMFQAWLENA